MWCVHNTWPTANVCEPEATLSSSWTRIHPQWHRRLWTDFDNRALVKDAFPQLRGVYNSYPYPIQRADVIRYCLLHRYGGIYADMDYEVFTPVTELMNTDRVALVARSDCVATNFLMASPPNDPFWQHVISALPRAHEVTLYDKVKMLRAVFETTGPTFLSRCVDSYPNRASITILPVSRYDPYDRHDYCIAPSIVRRALLALRQGQSIIDEKIPTELIERLRVCRGVHWRTSRWLSGSTAAAQTDGDLVSPSCAPKPTPT